MLVIREKQMWMLGEEKRSRFVERMVQHIASWFPKRFGELGEDGTRAFVRRMIEIGKPLRVVTEGAVATYIDLAIEYGEQFERSPDRAWARKMLAHPKLPDYVRMEQIRDRFRSRTEGRILVNHD